MCFKFILNSKYLEKSVFEFSGFTVHEHLFRGLNIKVFGPNIHLHLFFVHTSGRGSNKSMHLPRLILALLVINAIIIKISFAGPR